MDHGAYIAALRWNGNAAAKAARDLPMETMVPSCPECGGDSFRRASLFDAAPPPEEQATGEGTPDWLAEARSALVTEGDYIAFEDERVRVVPLQDGWTRVGRSLAADVRFDDPTVSRRHALIVRQADGVRVLDDRSLNGVFVNGERVEWRELHDGDEIVVGRYRLTFLEVAADVESVGGPTLEAAG